MSKASDKREYSIAKHEKAKDWAKSSYIPKRGEFIVFEYEDSDPKLKIGDGITDVNELKFVKFNTSPIVDSEENLKF